jgi:hypothetical protein
LDQEQDGQEVPMQSGLRHGVVLLATMAGIGLAAAQIDAGPIDNQKRIAEPKDGIGTPPAQLRLTDEQRGAIAAAVRKEDKAVTTPPSFVISVGAPVPPAIELYMLPDGVLAQVPATKNVKYTVVNDQLVLVDPTTMRIVEVIKK